MCTWKDIHDSIYIYAVSSYVAKVGVNILGSDTRRGVACRQLQCDRVTLHKNLFLSYILNGIAWILYYTLAALDGEVLSQNPVSLSLSTYITKSHVS